MARVDLKDTIDFEYETYIWNSAAGKIPIFVFNSTVTYSQSDYYYYSESFTTVPIYWPTICFFGSINNGTALNPNYVGNVATGSGDGITSTITATTDTSLTYSIVVGNDDTVYETLTGGWGTNTEHAQTLGFAVIKMADGTCVRASSVIRTTKDMYGNDLVPLTIPSAGSTGTTTETPLSSLTSFSLTGSASYTKAYAEFITPIVTGAELYDPDNPYAGGDESTDPGDGQFDYEGDEVDIPDLPTQGGENVGMIGLYTPTSDQLRSFGNWLWGDSGLSISTFKAVTRNPIDAILGLNIVPVNVPNSGTLSEFYLGNVMSDVNMPKVTSRFVSVDCGKCNVKPETFTGSYLDYAPYTKCYIYLPYIGTRELNIDDVMNSTLNVVYHVDVMTGDCVAYLKMTDRTTGGVSQPQAVLYSFSGNCGVTMPITAQNLSSAISSGISAALSVAGVVATAATGGAAMPIAASIAGGATSNVANAVLNAKPDIQKSGNLSSTAGYMAIQYPYLIFNAPHTSIPGQQRKYTGYPSNKIKRLSDLSGFNIIEAVNLAVSGASGSEQDEIKQMLLGGVII